MEVEGQRTSSVEFYWLDGNFCEIIIFSNGVLEAHSRYLRITPLGELAQFKETHVVIA